MRPLNVRRPPSVLTVLQFIDAASREGNGPCTVRELRAALGPVERVLSQLLNSGLVGSSIDQKPGFQLTAKGVSLMETLARLPDGG